MGEQRESKAALRLEEFLLANACGPEPMSGPGVTVIRPVCHATHLENAALAQLIADFAEAAGAGRVDGELEVEEKPVRDGANMYYVRHTVLVSHGPSVAARVYVTAKRVYGGLAGRVATAYPDPVEDWALYPSREELERRYGEDWKSHVEAELVVRAVGRAPRSGAPYAVADGTLILREPRDAGRVKAYLDELDAAVNEILSKPGNFFKLAPAGRRAVPA